MKKYCMQRKLECVEILILFSLFCYRNEPSDCYSTTYRYFQVYAVAEGACTDRHYRFQQ